MSEAELAIHWHVPEYITTMYNTGWKSAYGASSGSTTPPGSSLLWCTQDYGGISDMHTDIRGNSQEIPYNTKTDKGIPWNYQNLYVYRRTN